MVLGGIPYYWRYLKRGLSLAQNLDCLCFSADAPLANEFDELYSSLFRDAAMYKKVVTALSRRKAGLTRIELLAALGIGGTGKMTDVLETLESSGFIRSYRSFGRQKRDAIYQLTDPFTLFHFRFLASRSSDERFWSSTISTPVQSAWRGLAFERLCLLHLAQIRQALGIGAVHVEAYGWNFKGDETYPQGVQVDLILERADNVINLCELKYSSEAFAIDKDYEKELARKLATFAGVTKTRKAVHLTLITANGLVRNSHAGRVQSEVTLEDLFV